MALQKQKDTQFGIKANYWKIVKTNIDWHNKKANIIMVGFENKASRQANNAPLSQTNFEYEGTVEIGDKVLVPFPFLPEDNIVAKSYELIKQTKDFAGALDVFENSELIALQ